MIYYLPIEHEEMRYTSDLDAQISAYLHNANLPFTKILPYLRWQTNTLPAGMFLNAPKTIAVKAMQIAALADEYASGRAQDGDIVFLSDMWFPGIESVRYLDFFCKKKVSLRGILHAGSFTDTDFVRQLERWASMFENTLFDIFDRVYVASNFIKHEVCSRRLLNPDKVYVTPFPLDPRATTQDSPIIRENIVIFNGRLCDEKQPWLFEELKKRVAAPPHTSWINTQASNLPKDVYYNLLKKAKCVVSFALQENFGFGIAEATMCGCLPVVPNRLVYPEFYPKDCQYATMDECVRLVESALWEYSLDGVRSDSIKAYLAMGIAPNISTWFRP